ncbi:hypothetical protein [Spirillospora sp. NPDC047279]|uniref:hypothetical protein n=1 Tax=Spirillospora sp. NPDC047279 TaxID=3155478 RepID=UPI0033F8FC51
MSDRFQVEYRPAADLHDHYRSMESKMWSHVLLVLVILGAVVLVADLAAGFIPERGTIFLLAVVILLIIVLMLNQTWTRLDKISHDQDKMLAMLIAMSGPAAGQVAESQEADQPQAPVPPSQPRSPGRPQG